MPALPCNRVNARPCIHLAFAYLADQMWAKFDHTHPYVTKRSEFFSMRGVWVEFWITFSWGLAHQDKTTQSDLLDQPDYKHAERHGTDTKFT